MNVRKCTLKNAQGGTYTYLQLVHNYRVKESGKTKTNVLMKLGREDQIEPSYIQAIIKALSAVLGEYPSEVSAGFDFHASRELGGTLLLDALWNRLGMAKAIKGLLNERQFATPVERLCFAMVAGRILAPGSKLSLEHWVSKKAYIRDLVNVDVHNLYRAMDLLVESSEELQKHIFTEVSKNAHLDVDLIFLDTTNTYFETDEDASGSGLLKRGHSKDGHPELPLVSIAFAVTRSGIPIRCWVFPGNTSDQTIVEQVKGDLGQWNLGHVVMVQDAGFNSADNRRILLRECGDYIIGEKLRVGTDGAAVEALHRKGRFRILESGLAIKDVVLDAGTATERRFIIVKNPEAETRDRVIREQIVDATKRKLDELSQYTGKAHTKAACALRSHSAYGRYIRQDAKGVLHLDTAKIASESLLDGKFLVSTSSMKLDAADIVAGYKQLWAIERVFKDMKNTLDIRPVYHRLDDRIRSHILICWLAMVLVRYAENIADRSWYQIEKALSDVTAGLIENDNVSLWYCSDISDEAKDIFKRLNIDVPKKVLATVARKSVAV
ncbi:MAG: IS1634 family transposase [Candidatus Hydrogenedentales bacterium]